MAQRWLAASLLESEKRFRRIKGYRDIELVMKQIEVEQMNEKSELLKAA